MYAWQSSELLLHPTSTESLAHELLAWTTRRCGESVAITNHVYHLYAVRNLNTSHWLPIDAFTLQAESCVAARSSSGSRNSLEGLPSKVLCAKVLRKYNYAHSGATHFSFNGSNNSRVSTPVAGIRLAHGLRACAWRQWEKRASELKLIHAMLPLQLRMAIYAIGIRALIFLTLITSCFAAVARSGVTPLILGVSNATTRFSSRSTNFCNFIPRMH